MIKVCMFVVLGVSIISTTATDTASADDNQSPSAPPSTTKNIFKPPNESKVTDLKNNTTPWVIPDLIPQIQEFKSNVFKDLRMSPQVMKIWDTKVDSKFVRSNFFNRPNAFLPDLDHPVPSAFANIISKSSSFFVTLTMPVFFEALAVNLAEFLLSHNIDVESSGISQKYVDIVSSELDKADLSEDANLFQATLNGYTEFVKSLGFKLSEVIDELLLLFCSEIIILHDK